MNSMRQRLLVICVLIMCWIPAHAYIDPGTGSALIQGLIGAIAAVGVTLKLYWYRIVNFLGRSKNRDAKLGSDSDTESRSEHTPS